MDRYCKCGCGRKIEPTLDSDGHIKGYNLYSKECRRLRNQLRKSKHPRSEVLSHLCECGCGRMVEGYWYRKYYERSCLNRVYDRNKRAILPDEERPYCQCGCMGLVEKDGRGGWKKYITGHFVPMQNSETVRKMLENRIPRKFTDEQKVQQSISRKESWSKLTDVEKQKIVEKRLESMKAINADKHERLLSNPPLCLCGCGLPVERKGTSWAKYIDGHYLEQKRRLAIEKRGIAPKCLCGCGLDVSWSKDNRRWNKYYGRHFCKSEEYRDNMSKVMNSSEKKAELSQKSKDNYLKPEYLEKVRIGRNVKPNRLERIFDILKPDMFIKYVGDFKLWITLPNGKSKNPDFIIEGTNKVIEIHGDYWHDGEDERELIKLYKESGYECLVIWEGEMEDDIRDVMNRVMDFISS